MKTLYIECNMGAAGDMLMAALLELHGEPRRFLEALNALGIPDVKVSSEAAVKCGVTGTHISVKVGTEEEESQDIPTGHTHAHGTHEHGARLHAHEHDHPHSHDHDHAHSHTHGHVHHHEGHGHHHTGMQDIQTLLEGLPLSQKVRADALAVYMLIAEAESAAHGQPVEMVHFHEVGTMDAVADIVGVCMLMEALSPQRVVVSPVHVGSGQVKCAHGILPVPAPATAHILEGVPTYGGQIQGELCTPTGAALLRHFADAFGDRPVMAVSDVGYGMGKKEFPVANCVRAFLGESEGAASDVVEISCNLDDMTGEALGFAAETLLENGALDVYMTSIQMKKNRPGQCLSCLCRPEDEEKMAALMLKHTTTFGVRSCRMRRHILARSSETVETQYGPVRIKSGTGYGVTKRKAEYEDLARLAREHGQDLFTLKEEIEHQT